MVNSIKIDTRPNKELFVFPYGIDDFMKYFNSNGPYFLGSKYSLADIHVSPFIARFKYTL